MAKKKSGNKGSGASWQPGWITGLIVVAALVAAALMRVPDGQAPPEATYGGPQRSAAELEFQLQKLHDNLVGIAGRGGTGAFQKIQLMADQAKGALDKAAAAETEDERIRILEEGLNSKGDWLSILNDHAAGLKDDAEKDDKEHAPMDAGDVTALTTETFTDYISRRHHVMVEFYAPWCPHCKKMVPDYTACADKFKDRAGFAMVDGTVEKTLTRVYDVGGYPTLKWFVNGRAYDYDGPRTKEAISEWVEDHLAPAFTDIESRFDLEEALKVGGDSRVWLVHGEGESLSKVQKAFGHAAEKFRGKLGFFWSPVAEGGIDAITLYRGHAEDQQLASEEVAADADKLIPWLEALFSLKEDSA